MDSEQGGVSSDAGGATSVGGGVSGEGSWVPLAVGGGSSMGVIMAGCDKVKAGSGRRGGGLESRPSASDAFSTKRHCMMLVSFPPVEIR